MLAVQHEGWIQIACTSIKSGQSGFYNPSAGFGQGQMDAEGLLASHSSQNGKLQVQGETLFQKNNV